MKLLYLDCSMGIAGDMLMAALLELHPDKEDFLRRLNTALPDNVTVTAEPDEKRGIYGTHVRVTIDGEEESLGQTGIHHPHVSIQEILARLENAEASETVKKNAKTVYLRIAEAESLVHNREIENIHLHELGSLDALADIFGVCMLMEELRPDRIVCSPIHVGAGTVRTTHGVLPVPAPATALLLRGVPIYGGEFQGELCTPTGAALAVHFADTFGPLPAMIPEVIGIGTGTKDFETANIMRVILGWANEQSEPVLELCCNLDDMTAEAIGFVQEELFTLGALDVYTTDIGMKKCRPGTMLTCMCRQQDRDAMLRCLFRNTTTLGVREYTCSRYTLQRTIRAVETKYGTVHIKTAEGWGVRREKPEYEDLARIAREQNISLAETEALL